MPRKNPSEQSVAETVRTLVEPFAASLGLSVWDVEFKKEGASHVLRVIIDKEGGVSIDDCEALSRAIDAPLDKADPIPVSYCLEVSSAGLDRPLKRDSDFEKFIGSEIEVHLYKAQDGKKLMEGTLLSYRDGVITLQTDGGLLEISRSDTSLVRLAVHF